MQGERLTQMARRRSERAASAGARGTGRLAGLPAADRCSSAPQPGLQTPPGPESSSSPKSTESLPLEKFSVVTRLLFFFWANVISPSPRGQDNEPARSSHYCFLSFEKGDAEISCSVFCTQIVFQRHAQGPLRWETFK